MRRTGSEVFQDATRFRLVSAVTRIHSPQHIQVGPALTCVLPRLHLTVDDACVFTLSINVMYLRYVCRFLQLNNNSGVQVAQWTVRQCASLVNLTIEGLSLLRGLQVMTGI